MKSSSPAPLFKDPSFEPSALPAVASSAPAVSDLPELPTYVISYCFKVQGWLWDWDLLARTAVILAMKLLGVRRWCQGSWGLGNAGIALNFGTNQSEFEELVWIPADCGVLCSLVWGWVDPEGYALGLSSIGGTLLVSLKKMSILLKLLTFSRIYTLDSCKFCRKVGIFPQFSACDRCCCGPSLLVKFSGLSLISMY